MRIGVYFDGFSSTREMLEIAGAAEEAGADSLWFAQHMGFREAFIWATAAVSVTKRIRLVPTAISPYLWPPLPVAMSIATLVEYAGPRVALAVSVGNVLNLAESGVAVEKPVTAMRDYVNDLRALWQGDPVVHEGHLHNLRKARMNFERGCPCPLYVASTGPQVLKLAGEIGDGVLLSAALTLESSRRMLSHSDEGVKAAGRPSSAVKKAGFILVSIDPDGRAARQAMLKRLAYLFRSKGHAANIATANLGIDHQAIMDCYARHEPDAAVKHLPEQAATVFGVAGTPAECREQIEGYLAAGFDEPIIEVQGDAKQRALSIELIRDLAKAR